MHQMIELHPKADALDVLGLPAIPYPVALPAFRAAVANDGDLPLADMLHGLQLRAADAGAGWQRLAPAMARLAELLAGDDDRDPVVVAGNIWRLEAGAIVLATPVLALRRGEVVVATITPVANGCLRIAAYTPLDAGAIGIVLQLASLDAADTDGPDGWWTRARHVAAQAGGNGAGATPYGLELHAAAGELAGTSLDLRTAPRRSACVAAELRAFRDRADA